MLRVINIEYVSINVSIGVYILVIIRFSGGVSVSVSCVVSVINVDSNIISVSIRNVIGVVFNLVL